VVSELLAGPHLARLAYISKSGRPKVVPIWFRFDDGDFVMVTSPTASKTAAIRSNPAVALTIDGSTPPYKVLLIDGDAAIESTEGMAPEYPEIVQRYLGPAAEGYLAGMRGRVTAQCRIRVRVKSWRILDFVKRFPKSLR
jgi:PPOX class probable F420-dependent enzyme